MKLLIEPIFISSRLLQLYSYNSEKIQVISVSMKTNTQLFQLLDKKMVGDRYLEILSSLLIATKSYRQQLWFFQSFLHSHTKKQISMLSMPRKVDILGSTQTVDLDVMVISITLLPQILDMEL